MKDKTIEDIESFRKSVDPDTIFGGQTTLDNLDPEYTYYLYPHRELGSTKEKYWPRKYKKK